MIAFSLGPGGRARGVGRTAEGESLEVVVWEEKEEQEVASWEVRTRVCVGIGMCAWRVRCCIRGTYDLRGV